MFASDFDALELVNTFREYDGENNPEAVVDLLETYIKGVRLQAEAEAKLKESAEWLAGFTLKDPAFVDVVKTFSVRFGRNRHREEELQASSVRPVTRFYIPDLDELNAGRNLRGQLSCILASTGVGKSHMAKYIGIRANVDDGLHVLHFQLEGSEEEALNAYSGGLIARNAFYFERGRISELEMRRFEKEIERYAGSTLP